LTVEFVAEGAPAWSLPQGGTVGGDGAGISARVGTTPFSSTSIDFKYPPVRLPQQPQRQAGWGTGSVTRHGRRGLFGWLPRRSVRQLVESVAALGLVVLFSPLLLATAIAIKVTSRGPVFFRQDRTGLHRDIFTMYKFRTMYIDNDDAEHRRLMREMLTADEAPTGGEPGIYKIARDPRVTRVGKFLRQFSIDELPQLWNVVRGEMSLVGPRPYVPWETEFFPKDVEKRFSVRPGMTGLWQVSGRSTVDYRTALQIDVHYAQNKSLWLDLRILARTAIVVFDRSGTR
jgi:lipopolysaccharide/colanic/teichoic acid biosynthesis glycosyltransferase